MTWQTSTGASGSQPALWTGHEGICVRPGYGCCYLVLTLPVCLGARKRQCVLPACTTPVHVCASCATCQPQTMRRKNTTTSKSSRRLETVPVSKGERTSPLAFSTRRNLSLRLVLLISHWGMSSSLARGFLKCLSAALSIHTGIRERRRYVYRVLRGGSVWINKLTKALLQNVQNPTNVRSFFFFQGIRCVCLEVSNFFPTCLSDQWCMSFANVILDVILKTSRKLSYAGFFWVGNCSFPFFSVGNILNEFSDPRIIWRARMNSCQFLV